MLGESPSELMQARSVLEGAVIALAAARVTRQGLDRVKACLDAMRNDIRRGNTPLEADRRFHVTIAELTGNTLLVRLVGELFDGRHGAITSRMSRRAENARSWQTAFEEHDAIFRALELRDPQEAAAAMCGHLLRSQLEGTKDRIQSARMPSATTAPRSRRGRRRGGTVRLMNNSPAPAACCRAVGHVGSGGPPPAGRLLPSDVVAHRVKAGLLTRWRALVAPHTAAVRCGPRPSSTERAWVTRAQRARRVACRHRRPSPCSSRRSWISSAVRAYAQRRRETPSQLASRWQPSAAAQSAMPR